MARTWQALQRANKQAMATAPEYRIEVSTRDLSLEQQQQFAEEAARVGLLVATIRNGWTLAITGLTVKQATIIRDGLDEVGIHSSIGISEQASEE